jgi:hypothetical protein
MPRHNNGREIRPRRLGVRANRAEVILDEIRKRDLDTAAPPPDYSQPVVSVPRRQGKQSK